MMIAKMIVVIQSMIVRRSFEWHSERRSFSCQNNKSAAQFSKKSARFVPFAKVAERDGKTRSFLALFLFVFA